jgi:hypothetical protein
MTNKNIYDNIFKKRCAVCGHRYMADIYDQGECSNCGWYNGKMYSEFPDKVIYSNLISLNRAKQLYKEKKPFEPNIDEFIEALFCYSEMRFEYKGTYYGVVLTSNNDKKNVIEMFEANTTNSQTFETKNDFKEKAKIGNAFLKDIWNETTDRYWM